MIGGIAVVLVSLAEHLLLALRKGTLSNKHLVFTVIFNSHDT